MKKKNFLAALLACILIPVCYFIFFGKSAGKDLPCDIYAKDGAPCVTAHSTTRLLYSKYQGPLYQISRDSDGKTLDIYPVGGYADAAAQDEFLSGVLGHITVIYDQSGKGNDLLPAGPGTFKGPDKGEFNTMSIADMAPVLVNGHKAYGVYVMPGMGYRCNNARGLAINDEPEGIYYVIDGHHFDSGCCFDYGNSSTNGKAVGTGTMETTYYGTATAWGSGNGNGPWIMSDMEAGLFSGYNAKKNDVPSITDWDFLSVFVNGGGGNQWDLRGNDASIDTLITFYSGVRPHTNEGSNAYYPMNKKGGMLLGNGGDNGNGSAGTFFEGVMTFGYPSDDAINAVQKNIAAMGYAQYPLSVARISDFKPGSSNDVAVAFTNRSKKALKNFTIKAEVPEGWEVANYGNEPGTLDAAANKNVQFSIKAPQERASGYVRFTASWDGGSFSASERIRCAEPVRINEVSLSTPDGLSPQFIELYNAGDTPVDISSLDIVVRRSGWASVKAATIPAGTTMAPHSFYLISEADAAASIAAPKGGSEIFLTKDLSAGTNVKIGDNTYKIAAAGAP
ncbi:MAG: arabinofuranosidase catalytic domain-containing protein, partial [Bacteroidia bacterium]|nr:arabinofuranosidase catalytic domain-containing protein [Bacteroidia bacterium]